MCTLYQLCLGVEVNLIIREHLDSDFCSEVEYVVILIGNCANRHALEGQLRRAEVKPLLRLLLCASLG